MVARPVNALNISASGIPIFDGVSVWTSTTTTQYNTLVGGTGNAIVNIAPGTAGMVLTSGGASANPSYQTIPTGFFPYTDKSTDFSALVENGYFVTANAIATLPPSPSQGNAIEFIVDSVSGILTITANTGQFIRVGPNLSASAGTCVSNFDGDSITLVYRAADTTWISKGSPQGTWTLT
jgi:hypothetical protein